MAVAFPTRHGRSWVALAVLVLVLGACQGTASPAPSGAPVGEGSGPPAASSSEPSTGPPAIDLAATTYEPDGGRNGGTLVVGDWQEANLFNPYYLGAASDRNVAAAAWSTLVKVTADDRFVPDLAAELPTTTNGGVKVPGDGNDAMTVVWTIRDGLEWSDGEPLTCDDFRYAWEWVRDPQNLGVDTSGFEDIKAFDCESATRMIWHFERVDPSYLTLMPAPLPRHYLSSIPIPDQVAGTGFKAADLTKLPVSGPFKFRSALPGSELTMVRNGNYHSFSSGKVAHLQTLVWRWLPDAPALIAAYKTGGVNLATGLSDGDLPAVAKLGAQAAIVPARAYEAIVPNWAGGVSAGGAPAEGHCSRNVVAIGGRGSGCPMADAEMRRALAAAIDRQAIVDRTHGGIGLVEGSGVPDVAWFASGDHAPAFDPARARQILDAAGWRMGSDGIRTKDGLRAQVELCLADTPANNDAAELIVAGLHDVGVDAVRTVAPLEALLADPTPATANTNCTLAQGNFDLALIAVDGSVDPFDYFFAYHSSQIAPNGANSAGVDDPTIDKPLDIVAASVDPTATKAAMDDYEAAARKLVVDVPLYWLQAVDLHAKKVGNYRPNPATGIPTWNVVDWYVGR